MDDLDLVEAMAFNADLNNELLSYDGELLPVQKIQTSATL